MEFYEKLQELRKSRGLTQEELAEALYVSRTAVSKWESGRGYPSIDSLKEISRYFSVTIDDLLSGEALLSLAEKENRARLLKQCNLLSGLVDLFSVLLILLPLYPKTVEGYVYSVNLWQYTETTVLNRSLYWSFALGLVLAGVLKLWCVYGKKENLQKKLAAGSLIWGVVTVLFLTLAREAYAAAMALLLLVSKGLLEKDR